MDDSPIIDLTKLPQLCEVVIYAMAIRSLQLARRCPRMSVDVGEM